MKPRDKTVLPFALPAISVLVVILFAWTGQKDGQVKKLSTTKTESKPYYAKDASGPIELNTLATSESNPPVWPGSMRRLPPVEFEEFDLEEFELSDTSSAQSLVQDTAEQLTAESEEFQPQLNLLEDIQEFAITPPKVTSEANATKKADALIDDLEQDTTQRFEEIEIVEAKTLDNEYVTVPPTADPIEPKSDVFELALDPQPESLLVDLIPEAEALPEPEPEILVDPKADAVEPLAETSSELPEFAFNRTDAATPLLEDTPTEPKVERDIVVPIEAPMEASIKAPMAGPVAGIERDRSWAPVDLRSVEVDLAVGEDTGNKTDVASGENKRQALKAVELGFELIQRGAPYSARARFIEAMRSVSRSLDEQNGTHSRTAALRKALNAYEEAGDFFPKSTRPDEDINNASVVSGHTTEILEDANVESMTAGQCVQEYLAFAEQEFTKAFGHEEIASKALYGLGRLEWSTATTTSSSVQVRTYRSISLYQSALVVFDQNFAAANELGVLFARHGNYQNAISALRHCVALSPQPTAWQNLANLYRRLGKVEEARWAEVEATQSARLSNDVPYAAAKPRVEWVNPDEFNAVTQRGSTNVSQMPAAREPVARPAEPAVARTTRLEDKPARKVARRRSLSFGSRSFK